MLKGGGGGVEEEGGRVVRREFKHCPGLKFKPH